MKNSQDVGMNAPVDSPTHHHDCEQSLSSIPQEILQEQEYSDGTTESLGDATAAWTECAQVVKKHSDEMVKRWKDEIDTLLVYAGLFSAVITTFNVQSYALLQQSSSDASVAILAQISDQLKSFSLNPPFVNSTSIPAPLSPPSRGPTSAVWLNVLWFSSLICSLSAASIGILVKQWLHEAELGLSGTSREAARVRQYRYDGLRKWQVGTIVATLPVLLQLAAVLFFSGLLVLLWTLHPVVATVASALVGSLFLFTIATIILPAFVPDCTYRSPQALGIFLIVQAMGRVLRPVLKRAAQLCKDRGTWLAVLREAMLGAACSDWGAFRGWAGRERVETAMAQNVLDENILKVADAVLLDNNFLDVRIYHLGPLWGRYGSLGHRYEAQVELAVDVIERCLQDPVRLYVLDDLKSIVQELLSTLQYPLTIDVGKRAGRVVAGVVGLGGDFPHVVMDTLHARDRPVEESFLDISAREVVDALERWFTEETREHQAITTCTYADCLGSIALRLHPHLSPGLHCDYVIERVNNALVSLDGILASPGWDPSLDTKEFRTAAIRLLETLHALGKDNPARWSHHLLVRLQAAVEGPPSQTKHSRVGCGNRCQGD